MVIHAINTGYFKLDGGAMHGIVPKQIWNKTHPADDNNLCTWAMRCMLIESGNRLILIDTGCGNKQDDTFFKHYFLHGHDSLDMSIQNAGYHRSDITDVILTHLHFDHVGGALVWDNARAHIIPRFANASYWVHPMHWQWAANPNPREAASFLKDNILPLQNSGQLKFVYSDIFEPEPNITFFIAHGHTESMIIPMVNTGKNTICFMADLIPSVFHIPIIYNMAYDIQPMVTMNEKKTFLDDAFSKGHTLFFQHDAAHECATLQATEKGIRVQSTFALHEL
ncbi:MAG: MBL fold metallo-hydrolase [Cytophagales bacterium]|nr:MBL fold metallo-hydrolase [Cytophagales bacterium]